VGQKCEKKWEKRVVSELLMDTSYRKQSPNPIRNPFEGRKERRAKNWLMDEEER